MMKFPKPFTETRAFSAGREAESGGRERTGVTVVPFDVVEVIESGATLFTVPEDEYYKVTALSYLGRVAGTAIIYCRPDGASTATSNQVYIQTFAAQDDLNVDVVVGHYFGPGESLVVQTTGTSATANFKVSAERITGFLP